MFWVMWIIHTSNECEPTIVKHYCFTSETILLLFPAVNHLSVIWWYFRIKYLFLFQGRFQDYSNRLFPSRLQNWSKLMTLCMAIKDRRHYRYNTFIEDMKTCVILTTSSIYSNFEVSKETICWSSLGNAPEIKGILPRVYIHCGIIKF
jgi:hypothetical protein